MARDGRGTSRSFVAPACIALTKSEAKEGLLAVYRLYDGLGDTNLPPNPSYNSSQEGSRDPPPLGRPSFEQTTYNIQVVKTPWQYLGRKSHCWKAHFLKICFFVKYSRQRLLSLVNMGLHAAIIRLSNRLLDWARWYTRESSGINHIDNRRSPDGPRMVIWWVASVTPALKNPGYALRPCTNVCKFSQIRRAKNHSIKKIKVF